MKKAKYIIGLFVAALSLSSCDDFLNREPLDFGDENAYFKSDSDLKLSVNSFYEYLPQNKALWGGLYSDDVNSDNQVAANYNTLFYPGDKRTVRIEDSEWKKFENLRNINFFINKTENAYGNITGNKSLVDHYLGEGYFFRAYQYFQLLRNYGDLPILRRMQTDDRVELAANSKRSPRNEVARFILEDLDKAIALMQERAPESGRVARGAAYALKSRVALYEGTWEKYHAGTCFVPGNDKWPGAKTWPDFTFKAGSAEAEVNFFLEEAYKAAEAAIALHPLATDMDGYMALFNSTAAFSNSSEVILARYYGNGAITHSCSAYLKNGGGCGVTRAAVNTFLMANGLPIYAAGSNYQGDRQSYLEFAGRDLRLAQGCRPAGRNINTMTIDGKVVNDTIYYYCPPIYSGGNDKSTTGYELNKWVSDDDAQRTQYNCTTAVPLLRTGECYLNYIEAYYLRHGNLGGNCDRYWRELRKRAGVDEDYNKTIAATVLSRENDLAITSKGKEVDPTLYNIRRERRCELLAEGLRLDDLKRWRSLDLMKNYQVEGFNLWDEQYQMYSSTQLANNLVSQRSVSNYLRPLQILATSVVYDGYNFPKQHYLEPIPISEFLLTSIDGQPTPIYQNPGWPINSDGNADYTYNCD
ncbi:MAG: RagB/SusD family nutrient uptake outer membrane protein [Muribaculaceae bacterium]|nr:RagB/SusD family nutrient uptake outer membrane protein [Muribaculaceae bacterium]